MRREYLIQAPADLGVAVRRRRRALSLTQAEAAALCRVGTRFLSDLENGKASLRIGKALQVLHAFGLSALLRRKA